MIFNIKYPHLFFKLYKINKNVFDDKFHHSKVKKEIFVSRNLKRSRKSSNINISMNRNS